jgi:hypothetical protein
METNHENPQGQPASESKKDELPDFSEYKPGDCDPCSEKIILEIIVQADKYIVTIDEEHRINYTTRIDYTWAANAGFVLNEVSLLEHLTNKVIPEVDRFSYKMMIAEGLARLVDDGRADAANEILKSVRSNVEAIGKENLRISYMLSSLVCTLISASILFGCWLLRGYLKEFLGELVYYGLLCSLAGGIGAFLSAFFRSKNYNANIDLSTSSHMLDGSLRIFYGTIAGLIIYLAIKGNALLGFMNGYTVSHTLIFFLCLVSGASELIIPSIIKQTETRLMNEKDGKGTH